VVRSVSRAWGSGLLLLLALGLLMGCGGGAGGGQGDGTSGGEGAQVDNVVWGTSSQGSSYHTLSVIMGDLISRETGIAITVQAVGGSDATARAIGEGKVDAGMIDAMAAGNAFEGDPPFDQPLDVRLLMQGNTSPVQLIVRADSGIETPEDLEEKRLIGERPALNWIRESTDAILDAYGVDPASVTIVSTADTNEAIDAMKQGSVDAWVAPGGVGAGNLTEFAQDVDVRWIDLSDEMESILEDLGPPFVEGVIPAGTYRGQEQDVHVPVYPTTVSVEAKMPEDAAYAMTKAVLENTDTLADGHQEGEDWTTENSLATKPPAPFHPGAVRYYEEVGAWTEEMQQAQDELLSLVDQGEK
jgi:TRAP transporter TAXI family solute receptor